MFRRLSVEAPPAANEAGRLTKARSVGAYEVWGSCLRFDIAKDLPQCCTCFPLVVEGLDAIETVLSLSCHMFVRWRLRTSVAILTMLLWPLANDSPLFGFAFLEGMPTKCLDFKRLFGLEIFERCSWTRRSFGAADCQASQSRGLRRWLRDGAREHCSHSNTDIMAPISGFSNP